MLFRSIGLGHEEDDEYPQHEIPDDEHVVSPPPLRVLVDESPEQGT